MSRIERQLQSLSISVRYTKRAGRFVFMAALYFVGFAHLLGTSGSAQVSGSTITFNNRAGEAVLVGFIGPGGASQTVDIPDGQMRTVTVTTEGRFDVLTRYGSDANLYRFSKKNTLVT